MAVVWIPSLLQRFTGDNEKVTVPGSTLGQVINNLSAKYPAIRDHIMNSDTEFQEGIALAVDGNISTRGLREPVMDNSEVHVIPAMEGGQA